MSRYMNRYIVADRGHTRSRRCFSYSIWPPELIRSENLHVSKTVTISYLHEAATIEALAVWPCI